MEIIKKQISLESLRTRTPGLMPYIPTNEYNSKISLATGDCGNWGGILCNWTNSTANTSNLMRDYFILKDIMRKGIELEKRDDDCYTEIINEYASVYDFIPHKQSAYKFSNGCYERKTTFENLDKHIRLVSDEDSETFDSLGGISKIRAVEDLIGILEIPNTIIGDKVPERLYLSQIEEYYQWFEDNADYAYGKLSNNPTSATYENTDIYYGGKLPKVVTKNTPKEYIMLYPCEKEYSASYTSFTWYRKFMRAPKDCCVLEEWNARGGEDMYRFLKTNLDAKTKKLIIWQNEIANNRIEVPTLDIPILLTQNLDDNGVMSVVDEDIEYVGNEAGYGGVTGSGYTVESKIQTLRTREKLYNDDGTVKQYIIDSNNKPVLPYKVKEGFDICYNSDTNKYNANYIEKITYYDENMNETNLTGASYVAFEYVFGGDYEASTANRIKLDVGSKNISSSETSFNIHITADTEWVYMGDTCDWFGVTGITANTIQQPVTANTIQQPVTGGTIGITASQNSDFAERYSTISFGTTQRKNYEEVLFTLIQDEATSEKESYDLYVNTTSISVAASGGTETVYIKGINTGWSIVPTSIPYWISINPMLGKNGYLTTVNIKADSNSDIARSSQIEIVADNDNTIKKYITITQEKSEGAASYELIVQEPHEYIKYSETGNLYITANTIVDGVRKATTWGYEVVYGDDNITYNKGDRWITVINYCQTDNTVQLKIYCVENPNVYKIVNVVTIGLQVYSLVSCYADVEDDSQRLSRPPRLLFALGSKWDEDIICEPSLNITEMSGTFNWNVSPAEFTEGNSYYFWVMDENNYYYGNLEVTLSNPYSGEFEEHTIQCGQDENVIDDMSKFIVDNSRVYLRINIKTQ